METSSGSDSSTASSSPNAPMDCETLKQMIMAQMMLNFQTQFGIEATNLALRQQQTEQAPYVLAGHLFPGALPPLMFVPMVSPFSMPPLLNLPVGAQSSNATPQLAQQPPKTPPREASETDSPSSLLRSLQLSPQSPQRAVPVTLTPTPQGEKPSVIWLKREGGEGETTDKVALAASVDEILRGMTGDTPGPLPPFTQNSDGTYVCLWKGCKETFSKRFSLKRHMKKHTGERPFLCPFQGCTKRFAEKSTLKRHVRTHTGERPYKCKHPGCNKTFADRTNVRRHQLIHTGEKPYVCPSTQCARRFARRSVLRKHVIKRHRANMDALLARIPQLMSDEGEDDDDYKEGEELNERKLSSRKKSAANDDDWEEDDEDDDEEEEEDKITPKKSLVTRSGRKVLKRRREDIDEEEQAELLGEELTAHEDESKSDVTTPSSPLDVLVTMTLNDQDGRKRSSKKAKADTSSSPSSTSEDDEPPHPVFSKFCKADIPAPPALPMASASSSSPRSS